ncbi:hypothetical protein ACQ4PT_041519 [Festuca glaucescens]
MDKPRSQDGSIQNKRDASKRMVRSNVSVQLHLLPTDVLCDILSRLSLKQVVRMNILSREWRLLGICHPDLVFTEDTFFGSSITMNTNPEPVAAEFITRVNNVLRPLWSTSTTTTTTVDNFVVKFGLNRHHMHHIDRWIDFSTASMAKHIGLDLFGGAVREEDEYVVPLCKLSGPNGFCVKSLDMDSLCLKLPPSFCGIANLKKLRLHRVSIDAGDLQHLMVTCAFLESLSLDFCPMSSLIVCEDLSQLQYLSVRECGLRIIRLQAPNLTTFEFDDCLTQIMLGESSKLLDATVVFKHISYNWCTDELDYILTKLPTAIPYVHKLFLNLVVQYEMQTFSKTHATFINLKHLNLNIDIIFSQEDTEWVMGLVNILELAPLLEELELHIACNRFGLLDRTVTAVPGPMHRHLKNVHITGFCEFMGIAELALYILGNAIVLERMIVDPVFWMEYGYPYSGQFFSVSKAGSSEEFVRPSVTKEELQGREFAEKQFHREEFRHILTIL